MRSLLSKKLVTSTGVRGKTKASSKRNPCYRNSKNLGAKHKKQVFIPRIERSLNPWVFLFYNSATGEGTTANLSLVLRLPARGLQQYAEKHLADLCVPGGSARMLEWQIEEVF